MGENIFRVFLSDLTTVRIICTHCQAAVELKLDALHRIDGLECPNCAHRWAPRDKSYFADLRHAMEVVGQLHDKVTIEFPIRLPVDR